MGKIEETAEVVGQVLRIAKESPELRAAGVEVGKTALTVTTAVNNVLLPLAAVNFAIEKARDYFESRFPGQFAETMEGVLLEDIVEPKASIAGPVLQGLAFSHEEEPLREMYLNLLRSSMDRNAAVNAHPAFAETIKQLTAEEAGPLNIILAIRRNLALGGVRLARKSSEGWSVLYRHLADITESETGEPTEDPAFPRTVDNWARLGLVEVSYTSHVIGDEAYSWMESRPEYIRLCEKHSIDGDRLSIERGLLRPTDFGLEFGVAVGIGSGSVT